MVLITQVGTSEAAEVLAINTLAPFIINSRLQQLLERAPGAPRRPDWRTRRARAMSFPAENAAHARRRPTRFV
eukprot:2649124-Pleurochrysis_carterae.AAC.1